MLQPNTTFLELKTEANASFVAIVKAGAVQGGIVIVLAVSSSGGCNPLQLAFYHLTTVMFLRPFTDNEGQRFIQLHNRQLH